MNLRQLFSSGWITISNPNWIKLSAIFICLSVLSFQNCTGGFDALNNLTLNSEGRMTAQYSPAARGAFAVSAIPTGYTCQNGYCFKVETQYFDADNTYIFGWICKVGSNQPVILDIFYWDMKLLSNGWKYWTGQIPTDGSRPDVAEVCQTDPLTTPFSFANSFSNAELLRAGYSPSGWLNVATITSGTKASNAFFKPRNPGCENKTQDPRNQNWMATCYNAAPLIINAPPGSGGTPPAATCSFNGTSIANGASFTAFQNSSVASGLTCKSEVRTCANGVLSGSYGFTACAVQPAGAGGPAACATGLRRSPADGICHGMEFWQGLIENGTRGHESNDCANPSTKFEFKLLWAGPNALGCLGYTLSTPNRKGESASCSNFPNGYVPLSSLPQWSYNGNKDEWTSIQYTANSTYVPGAYRPSVGVEADSDGPRVVLESLFNDYILRNTAANADPNSCTYVNVAQPAPAPSISFTVNGAQNITITGTYIELQWDVANAGTIVLNQIVGGYTTPNPLIDSSKPKGTGGLYLGIDPQTPWLFTLTATSIDGKTSTQASVRVAQAPAGPGPAAPCSYYGGTINSGDSVLAYQSSTVPFGQTCASELRTCTNGNFSGSFGYANCSVLPDPTPTAACSLQVSTAVVSINSSFNYIIGTTNAPASSRFLFSGTKNGVVDETDANYGPFNTADGYQVGLGGNVAAKGVYTRRFTAVDAAGNRLCTSNEVTIQIID